MWAIKYSNKYVNQLTPLHFKVHLFNTRKEAQAELEANNYWSIRRAKVVKVLIRVDEI